MTEVERRIARRHYKSAICDFTAKLIKALYDEGYSVSDICGITGLSENRVIKYITGDFDAK